MPTPRAARTSFALFAVLEVLLWVGTGVAGLWITGHNFTFANEPPPPEWANIGMGRGALIAALALVAGTAALVSTARLALAGRGAEGGRVESLMALHVALVAPAAGFVWLAGPDVVATPLVAGAELALAAGAVVAGLARVAGAERGRALRRVRP